MPMGEDPRHGLLVALVVALVGVLLLIFAALAVAPVLVIVLGLMTYVVWWYVSREDTSYMHHAQEHENRFWTTVAFCFSGALIFVHDSPVALGQWSPVLGFLFVMMFTFSVHSYDRQLHRSRIGRAPNFRSSVESSTMLHSNAQDKCRRISVCLSKLDNRLVATNLNHMLWADMVQNLEKEIVNILSDADPAELNYMLPKIGLGLLFYKVKDHAPINLHRTRLLNVLADNRISDLNVTSRALVLDALQQLKLSAHKDSEAYVKKIIFKTTGDALSELKSLTDAKGDIHSLHKLVYRDIKDLATREEVLKHIANQARVQAAHMRLGTRTGSRRSDKAWRKILSDVDDTLTSSGGRFPAGVDRRYPRKSVYPGVLDFYRELDLGANGPSEWPKGQLGNLVFLSARPHVYKDMSESKSYAKFKKLQDEKGLYTSPTLLAGSIDTGTTMLLTGNMEPVAEKKFQNFAEYVSLYPEFKHVFVGDNGQGDVRAAEMMAERYPGKLEAVYVHRVVPEEKTFGYQGAITRQNWKKANIVFVGDYVEAACHAYKHGMIQAVGLQRVCQGAVEQFVDMKFEGPLERELQRRQINQSVWKANKLLQAANLEPNWLIRAVRAFEDLEAVLTPFGRGTVVNFRPEDGVYEVLLDWSQKASAPLRPTTKAYTPPVTPSKAIAAGGRQHSIGHTAAPSRAGASLPSRPSSFPRPRTSPPSGVVAPAPLTPRPASASEILAAVGSSQPLPPARRGGNATNAQPGLQQQLPPTSGMMSQRGGPDAAGGGEAVDRGGRARNAVHRVVTEVAGRSGAATVAAAAYAAVGGIGGAGEAAGGPAAAAAVATGAVSDLLAEGVAPPPPPSPPLSPPPLEPVEETPAEREARLAAAAARAAAAAEAVQRSRQGDHGAAAVSAGRAGGEAEGRVWDGSGGTSPSGLGSGDADGRFSEGLSGMLPPSPAALTGHDEETVAADAAKVLTAKMPGSMAVRAYLQLPSLRKAPPEVKKTNYKDDTGDDPKPGRLSTRLSIFSRQQDGGSAGGGLRSSTKPVVIAKGVEVQTFLGPATVRKVRQEDGMCEVAFHKWVLSGGKPVFGVFREADLVAEPSSSATVGKSPSLFGRTGKAISSLFKLSGEPSASSAAAAATPAPPPPEPRVGDIVDTVFGPAAVTAIRGPPAGSPLSEKKAGRAGGGERDRTPGAGVVGVGGGPLTRTVSITPAAGNVLRGSPEGRFTSSTTDTSAGGMPLRRTSTTPPFSSARPPPVTPPRPARETPGQQQQRQWTAPPVGARSSLPLTPPPPSNSSSSSPGDEDSVAAAAAETPPDTPTTRRSTLPPLSPVPGTPSPCSSRRPRGASISVPGRDNNHNHHHQNNALSAGGDMDLEGLGELGRKLSGSAAGDLLPGQLLSSPTSISPAAGQRGGRREGSGGGHADRDRASPPPSPAVAPRDGGISDDDDEEEEEEEEEEGEEAKSPLGLRVLERRGEGGVGRRRVSSASPPDAVMYEVAFMKWRLTNNAPARAVLNRASIWAEWEKRPSPRGRSSSSFGRRRSGRLYSRARRSSRPSSFFGFMSRVGNYAGGGGTTKLLPESPPGDRRKPRPTKSPAKPASLHMCDFAPGVCVKSKLFGPALVTKFRREDGIYQVSLLSWRQRSGGLATASLSRSAIASSIAVPGTAVRTIVGLGTVQLIREDGVCVVVAGAGSGAKGPSSSGDRPRAPSGGATMFLQLSAILGAAKATLGERVDTLYGWGVLEAYHTASDTYVVDLGWGSVRSPHGSAIKETTPLMESTPLSARSSGGIINLFRWPLFGGGPSASAAPFPPLEI